MLIIPLLFFFFQKIQWFKGAKELSKRDYTITHTDGVIILEIIDCKPEDSGKYRCVATNEHGTDETSCVVIVEGNLALKMNERIMRNIIHMKDMT